ncbi:MAG TPA: TraR/DksA C4-type zinc finger protein [Terriglobia bacterium]|jgi:DnaK suppressor protein|nr:TraR/DksA C4-type zinc finger protein [Terriglobia bacterium]
MDLKKSEHYKKKLLEKKGELYRVVSMTEQYGREADGDSTQDVADKAANSYTKEFLFSQSSNERNILQLVNEALGRVEDGTFGVCVSCDNEIQQKRLEAVPWTRHCINCQERQEQGLLEE